MQTLHDLEGYQYYPRINLACIMCFTDKIDRQGLPIATLLLGVNEGGNRIVNHSKPTPSCMQGIHPFTRLYHGLTHPSLPTRVNTPTNPGG